MEEFGGWSEEFENIWVDQFADWAEGWSDFSQMGSQSVVDSRSLAEEQYYILKSNSDETELLEAIGCDCPNCHKKLN